MSKFYVIFVLCVALFAGCQHCDQMPDKGCMVEDMGLCSFFMSYKMGELDLVGKSMVDITKEIGSPDYRRVSVFPSLAQKEIVDPKPQIHTRNGREMRWDDESGFYYEIKDEDSPIEDRNEVEEWVYAYKIKSGDSVERWEFIILEFDEGKRVKRVSGL